MEASIPIKPVGTASDQPVRGPNCWECRFLKITYMRATPYSCTFMGFRSQWLPSLEVLRSDGEHCKAFQPKNSGHESHR